MYKHRLDRFTDQFVHLLHCMYGEPAADNQTTRVLRFPDKLWQVEQTGSKIVCFEARLPRSSKLVIYYVDATLLAGRIRVFVFQVADGPSPTSLLLRLLVEASQAKVCNGPSTLDMHSRWLGRWNNTIRAGQVNRPWFLLEAFIHAAGE